MPATTPDTHDAIDAVWRIESARLIAGLTRITGDVGLAEDLAQDALVAALERWPESGIPDNPGAWLMATAKHRAIDQLRRRKMLDRKHEELGYELDARQATAPDFDSAIDDQIGDDMLSLIFTACHPVLTTEARTALTLGLLGHRRRRLVAAGVVRGRTAPRAHSGGARTRRAGSPRPRGAAGDPGVAPAGAGGPGGPADPAARSGPQPLGSAADSARPRRPGANRGSWRRARAVCPAGRYRRLPRTRPDGGRDRLDPHHGAVRCPGAAHAVPDRRAESRRGLRHGVRARRGPRDRRSAYRRSAARRLSSITCRARRLTRQTGPVRRSA